MPLPWLPAKPWGQFMQLRLPQISSPWQEPEPWSGVSEVQEMLGKPNLPLRLGGSCSPLSPSSTPMFGQTPAMQFSSTQSQDRLTHSNPNEDKNTQKAGMRIPAKPKRLLWIAPLTGRPELNTIPAPALFGKLFVWGLSFFNK